MNAPIEIRRHDETRGHTSATLAVVLVAPRGRLTDCDVAITRAVSGGAVTLTCEVDIATDDSSGDDASAFGIALEAVGAAVERATLEFPDLPVVLVGHAGAGLVARVYSEMYPDDLSGVVLTERAHQHAA